LSCPINRTDRGRKTYPDTVVDRAHASGVNKLICVGCDLEDSKLAIDYVAKHDQTWASIGIHPHEAKHFSEDLAKQEKFRALTGSLKVVAIGECGLDYYYNHSDKADQIKVLEIQLQLAEDSNLPVIFHVREALDDFWPIFDNFTSIKGVLHSYTDNLANLEQGLKRGLHFGVNGIATFTKKEDQLAVYKQIPTSNLLLETDAPFLTPIPYRGTINEPSKVEIIARFIAECRGEDLTSLAHATSSNACKLFGI
jgi:TatD DNase family protein